MQSGLIQQYENSGPYNFYKELYRGNLVRQFYTKKGSKIDITSKLASEKNLSMYKTGRKFKNKFRKGDLTALEGMIKNKVELKTKDINIIRNQISPHQNIILHLNNNQFTLTTENMDKYLEEALRNLYYKEYVLSGDDVSDGIITEMKRGVSTGYLEILERPKKERKNKNAKLFNFINTTDIDLTRYQIIKNESQKDIVQMHCLIHTLIQCGISEVLCKTIALNFESAFNFPKSKLDKVCNLIKCNIELHHVRDTQDDSKTIFYTQIYNGYKKEERNKIKIVYDNTVKIAMYQKHYFVFEDVEFSLFSIKNYTELKDQKDFHLITERNGKYYRKRKFNKINSLELVYYLFQGNHFKQDNLIKLIDPREKAIYLNNIETEQTAYISNEIKVVEIPVVFYADTETDVSDGIHKALYISIIDEFDEQPQLYTYKFNEQIYDYIHSKLKKLKKPEHEQNIIKKYVPVIYFHNMKYDFNVIKNFFRIQRICDKDGALYCVEISTGLQNKSKKEKGKYDFINDTIKIKDSYKMINIPLAKFNKTFGLPSNLDKKEAIAYTYYNSNTKYNTLENVDVYIKHVNKKDIKTFKTNLLNISDFGYNEYTNTFDPYCYYLYYLRYDVLVLRAGLQVLHTKMETLTGLNIYNILTISSLVDKSFKQQGCYDGVYSVKGNLRDFIGSAIYGGRVAVNQKFVLQELNKTINDYDSVSLYPSSLSRLAKEMGLPTGPAQNITSTNYNDIKNFIYYIVKINLIKINKTQQIPFIGVKRNGILDYINDAGDGIIMTVDKITLEDYIEFHHIEFEIIEGVYWNGIGNKDIGNTIDELFADRIKYKQEMKHYKPEDDKYKSADTMQNLIKLMLNSAYGKTIIKKQNTSKIIKYTDTPAEIEEFNKYRWNNFDTIKVIKYLNDESKIVEQYKYDDSENFAHIGCMILSYSKRIMNEVMNIANDNNINIYYQDTDSMHIDNIDIPKLEELYQLKYNKQIRGEKMGQFHSDFSLSGSKKGADILATTSIFLGKKCYLDILESVNNDNEKIYGAHIRLKGITEAGIEQKIKFFMELYDLNRVDAIKLMFNKLKDGEPLAFILNPIGEKVLFRYTPEGVITREEFKRVLKY
jgi:hypothetical protein